MTARLVILLAAIVSAKTVSAASPLRSLFNSKQEAVQFAEKSFAGGSHEEIEVGKRKILVLYTYTSGVLSTDAAIYVEEGKSWFLKAYLAHIMNDEIRAKAEGGSIVLRAKKSQRVLLSVPIESQE
jgi:hypothetical protein